MSDKPDNQVPDPNDSADEEGKLPEEPEQIWPPPDESGDSASKPKKERADAGWSEEVEKIDEAIDELRRINNELPAEEPVSLSGGPGAEETGREIEETVREIEGIDVTLTGEADKPWLAQAGTEGEGAAARGKEAEKAEEVEEVGDAGQAAEGESEELPPKRPADQMVAAVIETPEPSREAAARQTPEGQCRVREQSEDELGQLWGNVFFSAEHPSPKAIIVTAARPGDGATQIATALALVGAEASQERRVALVDFNLRSPGIAKVLGIQSEPGLIDVLDGRCSLEAATHAVTLRNDNHLHVLPSGQPVDKPLGLLKSRQVQSLIGQLQDRYDHTIIDVAAAGVHPDPQVVGALVDGALFVARAGDTPREAVAAAKRRLDLVGVRWLGLVLNQRSDPIPSFLYRMT